MMSFILRWFVLSCVCAFVRSCRYGVATGLTCGDEFLCMWPPAASWVVMKVEKQAGRMQMYMRRLYRQKVRKSEVELFGVVRQTENEVDGKGIQMRSHD